MDKAAWTEVWEQMIRGPRVIVHLRHTESDLYEVLDPQLNNELLAQFDSEDDAERWLRKNDFIYQERRTPAPDGQGPDIISKFEVFLSDEDDPDAETVEPSAESLMQIFSITRERAEAWLAGIPDFDVPVRCCQVVDPDSEEGRQVLARSESEEQRED